MTEQQLIAPPPDPLAHAKDYLRNWTAIRNTIMHRDSERRGRLVWYVGICGFMATTGLAPWQSIVGRTPTPVEGAWFAIPWLITALIALAAHRYFDQYDDAVDEWYHVKLGAIDCYLRPDEPPRNDWEEILEDDTKELRPLKAKHDHVSKRLSFMRSATDIALGLSFVATIVGPVSVRAL